MKGLAATQGGVPVLFEMLGHRDPVAAVDASRIDPDLPKVLACLCRVHLQLDALGHQRCAVRFAPAVFHVAS